MKRKHIGVRITAIALALLMVMPQTALASDALGWDMLEHTTTVGQNTTVTSSNFWSDTYSTLRTEYYLTYTPSSDVTTIVSYGGGIYNRAKLSAMAATLEAQGYRVLGGINGDFFDLATGVPLGIVISDGVLRSSSSFYYAIGFMEDGSAFVGKPQLNVTATFLGYSLIVAGVNKTRTATDGYFLYTNDFGTSTTNTSPGHDVILTPVTQGADSTDAASGVCSNELTVGGQVTCQVTGVRESTDSTDIPEGSFVLSINYSGNAWLISQLQALAVGDTVVIDIGCEDARWTQATEAIGGLYRLLTDGVVDSELATATQSSAQAQAPRTAIGVKADGSVVFYTIDGREYGYSVGATLTQVAKRLLELGCVDAICLDGGGSTTIDTTMPDEQTATVLNNPSDGTERAVTDAVFLVSRLTATGKLSSVYVTADHELLLPGACTQLTGSGVDSAFYPMAINAVTWSAEGGSINESGVFVAGAAAGDAVITATAYDSEGNPFTGSTKVRVVTAPTAIDVSNEATGKTVTALTLQTGEQLSLTAAANWRTLPITGGDNCFTWAVDPAVGTIDAQGNLIAGTAGGTGNLTVTVGEKTVTIPVTVIRPSPFIDTDGSWAENYICKLYDMGVTNGVKSAAGLSYNPNESITRGEFFLMVARWMGLDVEQYCDTQVPFADADSIAAWALNGVKATYAMGILTGSEENGSLYAKTDNTITRAEAMAILGRTIGVTETSDLSVYLDAADIPDWALSYVQTLVAKGVVNGDEKGMINPNANLTRAEVAKILIVLMESVK